MSSASGSAGGPDACDILANLWQIIQTVLDDSAPGLEALGLTPKAFFLLEAVEANPFPALLARRLHLPPPTVTYLVKQLEDKGLLERRAEPGDLRKFRLVRTEAGREAFWNGGKALNAALRERLMTLEIDDIVSFDRIVRRLAGSTGVPRP